VLTPPLDERPALAATPALHPLLAGECVTDVGELFVIEDAHRSPALRVLGALTDLVPSQPMLQVDGAADVVRTVGALKAVNVGHRLSVVAESVGPAGPEPIRGKGHDPMSLGRAVSIRALRALLNHRDFLG